MLDGRWWDLGGQAVPDTTEDEHSAAIVSTTRADVASRPHPHPLFPQV